MDEVQNSERVKYSISIEMEAPRHESAHYLPDSLVVRFDKGNMHMQRDLSPEPVEQIGMSTNDVHGKVEPDRKLRLFMDIFQALAGDHRDDVKKEALVQELVNTGHFTEQEAYAYIKKAQNSGFIFERKIGMYALA